jgi:hypothetical protein
LELEPKLIAWAFSWITVSNFKITTLFFPPRHMDMKWHMLKVMLVCLFMSMLCCKIKIEIDINNDKLSKTIREHIKKIKGGRGGDIIKLINIHFLYHYFNLFFTFSK